MMMIQALINKKIDCSIFRTYRRHIFFHIVQCRQQNYNLYRAECDLTSLVVCLFVMSFIKDISFVHLWLDQLEKTLTKYVREFLSYLQSHHPSLPHFQPIKAPSHPLQRSTTISGPWYPPKRRLQRHPACIPQKTQRCSWQGGRDIPN